MQTLRNKLIAGGAVLILAAIGSFVNRQAAQAAGAPVMIESPIPLPVSGTVAATQTGTWNVGITGTPGVNINNSPTVSLASGTTLLARNLDDPGRIPYQSMVGNPICTGINCIFTFPAIPAGHRLVGQHIKGVIDFSGTPTVISLTASLNGGTSVLLSASFLPLPISPAVFTAFDQQVLFYVDSLSTYFVDVSATGATIPSLGAEITVTGYQIDCTAAPCAAIAQ